MLAKEIRHFIITPTLQETGTYCTASDILVYGTGHCETNYIHIMQIGTPKNGGVGFFEGQPSDFYDISTWLINGFNKGMLQRILETCGYAKLPKDPISLSWNLKLAVMFCRMHYWRVKQPLPAANDARGMAEYHKKYYNSVYGKADVDINTEVFQKIIDGTL